MYLKSIKLQNTGPIEQLIIEMPFDGDNPKPLVLVGPNGSGKSTVLSFIVNALMSFKQHVFSNIEIEKGRVYRVRSPLGIKSGAQFYYACLEFDHKLKLHEIQLDRSRSTYEKAFGETPPCPEWGKMPEHETSYFNISFGDFGEPHKMEDALASNCLLYFPADRFEPPDWLNSDDLSQELKIPEPSRMKGRTQRRILARNRLKPTMEWLTSVYLDVLSLEYSDVASTFNMGGGSIPAQKTRMSTPGASAAVYNAIVSVLREILTDHPTDQVALQLGHRRSRVVSVDIIKSGHLTRRIKDILSLSAGQSSLFCLFAGIILDADQAGMQFQSSRDIRGVVLIDEADLHLHLGLQHGVLPRLLALFPKVQFIMTVHSPLVVLGMETLYGCDGIEVIEMPLGIKISPESYSEFLKAFEVYSRTKTFEAQVLSQINSQPKPALLVEGKSDEILIREAWKKLNPEIPLPCEIIPCGLEPKPEDRNGGAEMLRRCVEFLVIVSDRKFIAIFDNDRKGNEQFSGITKKAFKVGQDAFHKKHASKDAHAILLPIPPGRDDFVTISDINQRYLEIEHYFSDEILKANGVSGPSILGTDVFEIIGDKVGFANKAALFSPDDFAAFTVLFARIQSLL
jgi:energy-coupling factor transporter ATP-binding protein EcfA2